ncbi:shikimate/quinate 5-dehydrogenase [Klebsiella variicola]|nr:shikimate/quinate 5-dehydrogenase [Klebsiella variicola]
MVSGTTQVVAVIGHPIAQVKSPDNFNRYFAEQHMDSVMIPVDIAPGRGSRLPQRSAWLAEHDRRAGDGAA